MPPPKISLDDLPDQDNTSSVDLSNLPDNTPAVEEPSLMSRAWHAISDPLTDAPSRFASSVANYIDTPHLDTSPTMARIKGFGAGAVQGMGDLISGFTSPISLGTMGLGGVEYGADKAGLEAIANAARIGQKVSGAPMVLHGASNVLSPDSTLSERGMGLTEMAGGAAGMFHTPEVKPTVKAAAERTPGKAKDFADSDFFYKNQKEGQPLPTETKPVEQTPKKVDVEFTDPYAKYRQTPVGTTYKVSPGDINRRKMADAIKLGFEYQGIDDATGKIILKKTKESPAVNIPEPKELETHALAEAANLPRTIMASLDMSAPLRQGLGLIHKKAFWTSLPDMVKSFGSEEYYKGVQESILSDPMFKKTISADGRVMPSFAEQAGLKLTDLNSMSTREESIMSAAAEKIPGIRASNRAYTAFLNKLRADTFKQMISDFDVVTNGASRKNLNLAHQIADFINTASGRGNLGKLEPSAEALSTVLFSPRLIASRLGMMAKGTQALFSPEVYMLQSPSVRREYLKSLFAIAGAAGTFTQLGRLGGGTVETDPASSDFGKLKFGNTRIDPYGGFQQYIVAAQRLMPHLDLSSVGLGEIGGKMKSSTTGIEYDLGSPRFGQSNRMDVLTRFVRSKTNPIINFGWGLLAGQKEMSGKPMEILNPNPFENSVAQRFLPMLSQDVYDLINDQETPAHAKALAAFMASVGMGSQTYGQTP